MRLGLSAAVVFMGWAFSSAAVQVTIQGTSVKAGETATCEVKAGGATGVVGADFILAYNATVLHFTKVELGNLTEGFLIAKETQPGIIRVSVAGPAMSGDTGVMVRATFTVDPRSTSGDAFVKFTKADVFGSNFAKTDSESVNGAVTITAAGGDDDDTQGEDDDNDDDDDDTQGDDDDTQGDDDINQRASCKTSEKYPGNGCGPGGAMRMSRLGWFSAGGG